MDAVDKASGKGQRKVNCNVKDDEETVKRNLDLV